MRQNGKGRPGASKEQSRGGTLLGVFIGLVLGILIALAVVWYVNRMPAPFRAPSEAPASTAKAPANATGAPAALPGKPGDPPQEKRFQFYDILPGKSEPKPDAAAPAAGAPAAGKGEIKAEQKAEAAKAGGPLSLQAGSFQTLKDAENLKATLALMGVEPTIQEVLVGGKQWFRVRVGPFKSFEELNHIKSDLAKSGIQADVVKQGQ